MSVCSLIIIIFVVVIVIADIMLMLMLLQRMSADEYNAMIVETRRREEAERIKNEVTHMSLHRS